MPAAPSGPAAQHHAENRRGILWMCAAMASFVINDALVKYASQSMPTAQLIFLRGAMATVLVLAVARALGGGGGARGSGGALRDLAQSRVALRAGVDAVATMLYLVSLFNMPLPNAMAINLASPVVIALLAALFLGERVDGVRWFAIGVGFVGVLLVVQPHAEGFNVFALVCLLSTLLFSVRDLLTRRIAAGIPSILITLSSAIAVTLLAGGVSLIEGWRPFGAFELGLLAAASVFLAAAYYAIISSLRQGEVSVIAPFRYTGLLWALGLGFLVWGDVPNLLTWGGIALLVCAGLLMLDAERRRVRAARSGASAAKAARSSRP